MLDADIDVFTAFFAVRRALVLRFFAAPPRFLPPTRSRRRFDGIGRNRWRSLPSDGRKHVCHRLRGQRRLDVRGDWQRRDRDHGTARANNRNFLFTMFGIFLHARNEGSVKQSMVEFILHTVDLSGHFKGLAATGATL